MGIELIEDETSYRIRRRKAINAGQPIPTRVYREASAPATIGADDEVRCALASCVGSTKFLSALDARREERRCTSCGHEFVAFNGQMRQLLSKGLGPLEAAKVLDDARATVLREARKDLGGPPSRPPSGGERGVMTSQDFMASAGRMPALEADQEQADPRLR